MRLLRFVIFVLSILLTACGGGGGSTPAVSSSNSNNSSSSVTTYSISGTASGVANGFPVVLTNNGGDTLTVSSSGNFTFPTQLASGSVYSVAVTSNPLGQNCSVSNGSGNISGNVTGISVSCSTQPYFVEIPNAFPNMDYAYTFPSVIQPKPYGAIVATAVADLYGDGKKELIISMNKSWFQSYETQPAQSQIFIFKINSNNKWQDVTSSLIPNNSVIPGAVQKFLITDVNGDGKPDIIIEVNQDDGRQSGNNSLYSAYSQILLSQPNGTYNQTIFGSSAFWLNEGAGVDINGKTFFALTGSGGAPQGGQIITWSNNGLIADNITFPYLSTLTFQFIKTGGSTFSNALIEAQNNPGNPSTGAQGYYFNGSTWVDAGAIPSPAYPVVATEQYLTWTGTVQPVQVLNYNGAYIVGSGAGGNGSLPVGDSCQLYVYPNQDPIVLFSANISVIKNYVPGAILNDALTQNTITFFGVKMVNGKLVSATPFINNQSFTSIGTGSFECKDINQDGYQDIIFYQSPGFQNSSSNDASPVIYLNNKDGTFTKSIYNQYQTIATTRNNISSEHSIIGDFNGDGIMDIVIFGNDLGDSSLNPIPDSSGTWKYYQGLKSINQ